MSNPFNGTGLPYFQLPQFLISSMLLPQLTGNEIDMYVFLCFESQRTSKITLNLSHQSMMLKTGISTSKVGAARLGLIGHGLIAAKRVGDAYAYTLCNPATGMAIKGESKGNQSINFDLLTEDQLRRFYLYHLKEYGVEDCPNGLQACCPFHDDHTPSLSVTLENGSAWQCHRCDLSGKMTHFEQTLAEQKEGIKLNPTQAYTRVVDSLRASGAIDGTTGQPEAIYYYVDEYGVVLFEVLRYPGKRFVQRRMLSNGRIAWNVTGCRKVLYRLEDVLNAETVIVTEGEKDCDRMRALGLYDHSGQTVAVTTNAGGAGKWVDEHALQLEGKRVFLLGDNDEAGRNHMRDVAASLADVAIEVAVMYTPEGFKDISLYLEKHSVEDFLTTANPAWFHDVPPI